jgi:outer membrane protein TolC
MLPLQAADEGAGQISLTFKEALGRIAGEGRAVRIAHQTTAMAHQDVGRARSPLLPQVNLSAGRRYYAFQPAARLGAVTANTSEKEFNVAGLHAYQTIYDFGVNSSNLKAARLLEGAMSDDAQRARNQAVLEFVGVYFDLLETDRLIGVARDELSSLALHLKDVTILWREGVAMKNDLLSVQVKFSFARQQLVTLRNQRKVAHARLCALLSLDEKVLVALEDPEVDIEVRPLSEAEAAAMAARPELKALSQAVQAADFRERASRAADRPSVFADGGYDYAKNQYQSRDDNWSMMLGLKFNIFNGGLTKAEAEKEAAHHKQLLEQEKQAGEDIRVEVEKAYWDLKTAGDKLGASRSAARQAEENLRVNRVQYREGALTSTAVLDAVALRSSAETNLWRSVYDRKRAWAHLLYAMGRDIASDYMK